LQLNGSAIPTPYTDTLSIDAVRGGQRAAAADQSVPMRRPALSPRMSGGRLMGWRALVLRQAGSPGEAIRGPW
jgi:hypothetical protein